MTKEEVIAKWNSLSPRERDAWIAETMMGLKLDKHRPGMYLAELYSAYIPNYSEKMSAAWQVLGKFPLWSMSRTEVFEGSVTYEVSVWSTTESDPVDMIGNVFASIACLAALIAHYETN